MTLFNPSYKKQILNYKHELFLSLCLFLFVSGSFAQTPNIDSLKSIYNTSKLNKEKIDAGLKIYGLLSKSNTTDALSYLKHSYSLAKESNFKKDMLTCEQKLTVYYKNNKEFAKATEFVQLAKANAKFLNDSMEYMQALNTEGIVYLDQKKDSLAEICFNQVLVLARKNKSKIDEAKFYNNLSIISRRKADYKKALELLEISLQLKKELGDSLSMAYSYYGISNILSDMGRYDDALKYGLVARELFENKGDYNGALSACTAIGSIYFRYLKDNKKAIEIYRESISLNIKTGIKNNIDVTYNNIANVYKAEKQLDSALFYYKLSYQKAVEYNNNVLIVLVENNLADLYLKLNKPEQAFEYANAAFQKSLNSAYKGKDVLNTSTTLSRVYVDLGKIDSAYSIAIKYYNADSLENKYSIAYKAVLQNLVDLSKKLKKYDDAIHYYEELISVTDSLSNKERIAIAADLNAKYETERKDANISRLNIDKKIQQLQLEKQKATIAGNLLEAKQKQQEIDLLNQHQQIQELKLSQQKEALALRELESQAKDRQLKINEQEKQLKDAELTQQRFSKNLILAGGLILLAFGALSFNLYRINTKRNNEREKFQLQNQLSEMKLEALRSQMNPHFIFNALNSINRYIIRSDKETASDYLIKFSKLMRLILENSKSSFIPLSNELEALRLYVEMELLRFDNKFEFNINIATDILQDKTQIPPMVLQPFIENAIWHGLMNKKEKGMITVNVESKSADKLFVIIEDNGAGRQKANEQRSQHAHTGKSFGMQITRDRLAGINGTDKQFRIIDLTDTNNNPAGTRVELEITTIAA